MRRFRNYLMLAAGIGVLTLTMSLTNAGQLLAQGMNPLLVRNADAAALRPFQRALCLPEGPGCPAGADTLEVPVATSTGEPVRRLVIEYVSTYCQVFGVTVTSLSLITATDGWQAVHHFIPIATSAEFTNSAQATRLYADPGSELRFSQGAGGFGSSVCHMALSGHLVVE